MSSWALKLDNPRLATVVELFRERSTFQQIDADLCFKKELVTGELLLSIAANAAALNTLLLKNCVSLAPPVLAEISKRCNLLRLGTMSLTPRSGSDPDRSANCRLDGLPAVQ